MNTKRNAILIIGALFLLIPAVKAQSKFHIILDYHYNFGICEKYWGRTFDREEYKMHGNSLHFTALYDITRKISALCPDCRMDMFLLTSVTVFSRTIMWLTVGCGMQV